MSSSDSEDDCYDNAASKLQKLKNCFQEDRLSTNNLLNDSAEIDLLLKNNPETTKPSENTTLASPEVPTLPSSTVTTEKTSEISSTENRRVTRASRKSAASEPLSEACEPPSKSKRGRKSVSNVRTDKTSQRGRGRGRRNVQSQSSLNETSRQNESLHRGRGRRRGRASLAQRVIDAGQPIYSVGNTWDYPDQSENLELFSSKPAPLEVIEIDVEDENVNEEMSIKVYWQNAEVFKFTVRRYQKFTQIFDYFAKKADVTQSNLLFTYEGTILNVNDTPDTISYSISKFIDGGVAANNICQTKSKSKVLNGLKIKFQCQTSKQPYETIIGMDEMFSLAMMKCAEHFELNPDKLRFNFDGDSVTGKQTPRDLDFEGGECIDVKILS